MWVAIAVAVAVVVLVVALAIVLNRSRDRALERMLRDLASDRELTVSAGRGTISLYGKTRGRPVRLDVPRARLRELQDRWEVGLLSTPPRGLSARPRFDAPPTPHGRVQARTGEAAFDTCVLVEVSAEAEEQAIAWLTPARRAALSELEAIDAFVSGGGVTSTAMCGQPDRMGWLGRLGALESIAERLDRG